MVELAADLPGGGGQERRGEVQAGALAPHSTVLVVGDVVGHGPQAARRAGFVRATFAATARFPTIRAAC